MDVIGFKLYLPHTPGDIFGSITVRPKKHRIPVKLVLYATAISTMNKSSLSMDCSLSDTEVIRRHGCRWSVECCCKVCKSLLKSGKEFRPVNDNATVSSTALVFTRLIILEWLRHKQNDQKLSKPFHKNQGLHSCERAY